MKAPPEITRINRSGSKRNALVVRLERNLKDVNLLKTKLSSYNCEPQTYSLFERIEALRSGLESLSRNDQEIITALKERKKSAKECLEKVNQHYSEFQRLQQGVTEYLGLTQNRYMQG